MEVTSDHSETEVPSAFEVAAEVAAITAELSDENWLHLEAEVLCGAAAERVLYGIESSDVDTSGAILEVNCDHSEATEFLTLSKLLKTLPMVLESVNCSLVPMLLQGKPS